VQGTCDAERAVRVAQMVYVVFVDFLSVVCDLAEFSVKI